MLFINKLAELVDLCGDGGEARTPEIDVGKVNARHKCRILYRAGACGTKHLLVGLDEGLALLKILRVDTSCEETAKGVGVVVEGKSAAVIMSLTQPHIGVHTALVKAVAVRLTLCIQHQLAHTLGREELCRAVSKYACLKEIAGVDVHDDLGCVHKLTLNKSKLRIAVGALGDSGVHNQHLVKGRCCLGNGHRIVAVEGRILIHLSVVEGVAKLVSKSHDVREGAVEVGKHS